MCADPAKSLFSPRQPAVWFNQARAKKELDEWRWREMTACQGQQSPMGRICQCKVRIILSSAFTKDSRPWYPLGREAKEFAKLSIVKGSRCEFVFPYFSPTDPGYHAGWTLNLTVNLTEVCNIGLNPKVCRILNHTLKVSFSSHPQLPCALLAWSD